MSTELAPPEPVSADLQRPQRVLRPYALLYLYRRRLRVHAVQELLAGVGVAVAVGLVFASLVAAGSIAGSAAQVVRAVTGRATLQLHARSPEGFPQALLNRVERLPGVSQAAPLLEQTATISSRGGPAAGAAISAPSGRSVTVDLAGADTALVVLDGLAHTLPRAALQDGGIGLSRASARSLGLEAGAAGNRYEPSEVTLHLAGRAFALPLSAVLGEEAFGALSRALVAVMPLEELQRLSGLHGRVSRVLVATQPRREAQVRDELRALAGGRIDVAPADQDVALLRQALRPSDQASGLFAAVSGLLGVLFAFTALLLTIPERRRAIADLRLIGVRGGAIAQMLLFQALALGVLGSLVGIGAGYLLALHVLHQGTGYLAEAFTLGGGTVVGAGPLAVALGCGVGAACLASALPLLDLRRGRALDAVYHDDVVPGSGVPRAARRALAVAATGLLAAATALFALAPGLALLTCALLALCAVLSVPLALATVLRAAHAVAARFQRLTVLPVALGSLRATALRSLALAATGAVALFGAVALGGGRSDLLHGIQRFARAYSADASVWIGAPGDNQATVAFPLPAGLTGRIERVPGVARVQVFQGGFAQLGGSTESGGPPRGASQPRSDGRRVWLLARPPGGARHVLASELREGSLPAALAHLAAGGWVAVSRQLAAEQHTGVGGSFTLPTPSGPARLRVAATVTNLAWSPGAVFLAASDYRRLWHTGAATALAVQLAPGADADAVRARIQALLGANSGLVATTAAAREARIDALTGEGLGQLGAISALLLAAAIVAMAAALTSAIWQRRPSLAALRLSGVRPRRLRAILAVESALMLGAGCLTGLVGGVYGQLVIDGYLRRTTGFPVVELGAALRPLELLALLALAVLALVLAPTWAASRVPPTLVFDE